MSRTLVFNNRGDLEDDGLAGLPLGERMNKGVVLVLVVNNNFLTPGQTCEDFPIWIIKRIRFGNASRPRTFTMRKCQQI